MRPRPLLCLAVLLLALPASGARITTTLATELARGELAGQGFESTPLSFEFISDTEDIFLVEGPLQSVVWVVPVLAASLSIDGLGTHEIEAPLVLFVNQTFPVFGFRSPDFDPSIGDNYGIACGGVCEDWDLSTSLVTSTEPPFILDIDAFPTSGGELQLTSLYVTTLESIVVPEPTTGLLLAGGLLWLARGSRRAK